MTGPGPAAAAVLVVDDDETLRAWLDLVLTHGGVRVLVASEAAEGLALMEREGDALVGVVISDHSMPGMQGADFLIAVRQRWPRVARILLTGASDMSAAARAVNQAQVTRLLLKPCDPDELVALARELLQQHASMLEAARVTDVVRQLTPRERQVLACLARGASNAQIASDLNITPGSARIYVNRLLAKLGLPDRTKAALFAREHGVAELSSS
jgi:two-component system nitrate/nitrite response regulator NarL